jgi:hypothetical protein
VKPQARCPLEGQRFAQGEARSRFAVRAPCAHQWLAYAPRNPRRTAKVFGPAKGMQKARPFGPKFFLIFFQNPLARGPQMWYHCTVQRPDWVREEPVKVGEHPINRVCG